MSRSDQFAPRSMEMNSAARGLDMSSELDLISRLELNSILIMILSLGLSLIRSLRV